MFERNLSNKRLAGERAKKRQLPIDRELPQVQKEKLDKSLTSAIKLLISYTVEPGQVKLVREARDTGFERKTSKPSWPQTPKRSRKSKST